MKPNASKNQKLLKQYPFVAEILVEPMDPFDGAGNLDIDELSIRVQKADKALMFFESDNIGLGNDLRFTTSNAQRNKIGKRANYVFAVADDDSIINRLDWPWLTPEEPVHLSRVFWKRQTNQWIYGQTKRLVLVTVETWYEDNSGDLASGSFGKFLNRSVYVIIYGEPTDGFERLARESSLEEDFLFDLGTLMAHFRYEPYVNIRGRLDELANLFRDDIYLGGLKEILDAQEVQEGCTYFALGPINVRLVRSKSNGLDQISLQDSFCSSDIMATLGSKEMYMSTAVGKLPQLRNLIRTAARVWKENPDIGTNIHLE